MTTFRKLQLTPAIFHLCLGDPALSRALSLYGLYSDSLAGIYPIIELVANEMGGSKAIARRSWTTKARIDLFFHSANTTNDKPRHGHINVQRPASPMSLEEAKALAETLLARWLEFKLGRALQAD